MRGREGWGFILLAIWLVIEGIIQLTSFTALGVLMGILAIAAGVLIILANYRHART